MACSLAAREGRGAGEKVRGSTLELSACEDGRVVHEPEDVCADVKRMIGRVPSHTHYLYLSRSSGTPRTQLDTIHLRHNCLLSFRPNMSPHYREGIIVLILEESLSGGGLC